MKVEDITFEEIKEIWEKHLWPNKKSGVKELNNWTWSEDLLDMLIVDENLENKTHVHFVGIRESEELVAVNSFYYTNRDYKTLTTVTTTGLIPITMDYWRSRGLWVDPNHRGKGYAKYILNECIDRVRNYGGTFLWTVPRKSALKSYESVGFVKRSNWIYDTEYGPNCIASRFLNPETFKCNEY